MGHLQVRAQNPALPYSALTRTLMSKGLAKCGQVVARPSTPASTKRAAFPTLDSTNSFFSHTFALSCGKSVMNYSKYLGICFVKGEIGERDRIPHGAELRAVRISRLTRAAAEAYEKPPVGYCHVSSSTAPPATQ